MGEEEQFSAFIGEIYDAALDTSRWTNVISKGAKFVGGCSAILYSRDITHRSARLYYHGGSISEHRLQLYFDKYVKVDPLMVQRHFGELEEPVAITDVIPNGEFLQTRFYKEWAQPQNLIDFVTCVLDRTGTSALCFGVFRHERDGVVDEGARQRMRLIVPHIRRTMLVNRSMELKASENATLADALDDLSAGMCLVSEDGSVVHANAAFQTILIEGDYLFTVAGRLSARDVDADQIMHEAFVSAAKGNAGTGVQGNSLPLKASDGGTHVAHILPLTIGTRRMVGMEMTAVAALFVHKMDIVTPSLPEAVARHFKLTPSELRILLTMIEEPGIAEVAQKLGVTINTVKTHLGRLFAKTGTSRQADLVKVVAGFSAPLLG